MKQIKKTPIPTKTADKKTDGWSNVITNLGVMNKDKRLGSQVRTNFLDQSTLEALYQADDVAQRIVNVVPDDMTREGFRVKIEGDEDLAEKTETEIEQAGIEALLTDAVRWARLYGGSMILIGVADGLKAEEPLDLNKIQKIEYMTLLDRYEVNPASEVNRNPADPNFRNPDFYSLSVDTTNGADSVTRIHHTRLLRFEGVKLPRRTWLENQYWGSSVLDKVYNPLRNFQTAHDSLATIIQDFTVPVFEMEDLTDLIAAGREDLVAKRIALVQGAASIVNAVVVSKGEGYERKQTTVAGIKDLADQINNRMVTASGIPHTILFGESPSGLGASGESEKNDWFNFIKTQQESILRPALLYILKIMFSAKQGVSKGIVPENYTVDFNDLWQMTEKETAELRKINADADQIYIQNGVLDPDEVTQARWGGTSYNNDIRVDMDARDEFDKPVPEPEIVEAKEDRAIGPKVKKSDADFDQTATQIRFRMLDPNLFDKDTFIIRKTSEEGISIVRAKLMKPQNGKEGELVSQSFRFAKELGWTLSKAKDWVMNNGKVDS